MSRYQPPELLAAPQTELGSIHQWCNTFSMDITTVSSKFQVVIPKRVREQFGLSPGQSLQVIALPGRIELVPSQPPAALRGFLQGKNTFQREGDRLARLPTMDSDFRGISDVAWIDSGPIPAQVLL